VVNILIVVNLVRLTSIRWKRTSMGIGLELDGQELVRKLHGTL